MLMKKIILHILFIFLIFTIRPSYAFNDINIKNNELKFNQQNIILPPELYLSLQHPTYHYSDKLIKQTYSKNIIVDNNAEYATEFFEFIGIFIMDYDSQEHFKVKLKFTHKAQLNKAKFYWQVDF